jgi:hypothetical protein
MPVRTRLTMTSAVGPSMALARPTTESNPLLMPHHRVPPPSATTPRDTAIILRESPIPAAAACRVDFGIGASVFVDACAARAPRTARIGRTFVLGGVLAALVANEFVKAEEERAQRAQLSAAQIVVLVVLAIMAVISGFPLVARIGPDALLLPLGLWA